MHEASLMAGLMRRIDAVARADGATRVTAVAVRLGALSHLSAEHFTGHFTEAARGTVAENARLDITVEDDAHQPHAQDILLESVEVET